MAEGNGVPAPAQRDPRDPGRLLRRVLNAVPGRASLEWCVAQIARLEPVRQVSLPRILFAGVYPQLVVQAFRQRAIAEPPGAPRTHTAVMRHVAGRTVPVLAAGVLLPASRSTLWR